MTVDKGVLPTNYRLASLMRALDWSADAKEWHAALYLAQVCTTVRFYDYRLAVGHVVSDDLEEELLQIKRVGIPAESLQGEGKISADENVEHLRKALESLRECSNALLEAAATEHFFLLHSYGDPASHLRWFNTLLQEQKDQAREFAVELAATASRGAMFNIAGLCSRAAEARTHGEGACKTLNQS
jgi:hypothetical protein